MFFLAVSARAQDQSLETRLVGLLAGTKTGKDPDRLKAATSLRQTIQKEGIGKFPVKDLVDGLSGFAKEKNHEVRRELVFALAAMRDEATLPALVEALDDRWTWSWSCLGLRFLGPKAKSALPKLVAGVKAGRLSGNAFDAIAAIAGKDATPIILDAIADPKKLEPNAYGSAVWTLSKLADPRASDFMATLLAQPAKGSYGISLSAAMFFAELGDENSLVQLRKCLAYLPPPEDAKEGPFSWKVSTAADIRRVAVEALGKKKNREAFEKILTMVADDPSIRVRTAAVAALGEYADARAVPVLVKAFGQADSGFDAQGHREGELRRTAVRSLARIGTDEAFAALYEGMRDGSAKPQCAEFCFNDKEPKHVAVFLKLFDAKPINANLGAGIIEHLLRNEKTKKLTANEQADAEADFRKKVVDPDRFGKDLTEGGKYTVRTSFTFLRADFATVTFAIRAAQPHSLGHGDRILYRLGDGKWKPVGLTGGWVE